MEREKQFLVPTQNRFEIFNAREMDIQSGEQRNNSSRQNFISSSMDDKLVRMFDELTFIRNEQVNCSRSLVNITGYLSQVDAKVQQVINVTDAQTELLKALCYKSIDQEARSRRNNLTFRGIVEKKGENCYDLILDFLQNKLDIEPRDIYIARAHRLGARVPGKNFHKRPIIVNFRDFGDVDYIIGKTSMLKDHPGFSVDCDYPKEIQAARSRLWPRYKEYRTKNPKSKVSLVYPAKVISDGRVVYDEFPNWQFYVNYNRLTNIGMLNSQGRENSTVQPQTYSTVLNTHTVQGVQHTDDVNIHNLHSTNAGMSAMNTSYASPPSGSPLHTYLDTHLCTMTNVI